MAGVLYISKSGQMIQKTGPDNMEVTFIGVSSGVIVSLFPFYALYGALKPKTEPRNATGAITSRTYSQIAWPTRPKAHVSAP